MEFKHAKRSQKKVQDLLDFYRSFETHCYVSFIRNKIYRKKKKKKERKKKEQNRKSKIMIIIISIVLFFNEYESHFSLLLF